MVIRQDVSVSVNSSVESGSFLDDLKWRGLVAQTTDEAALERDLSEGSLTLYCGFDPTAASLHIGNLVPLLLLRRFQAAGHHPIALVGGATGLVGDPSGRSTERTLNSDEVVSGWVERIRNQVSAFVELDGPTAASVVSNLDWTAPLSAIDFLRDIGKHFSVNVMLSRDSVRARLDGDGMSYTEFSYMLLQANDYLELYQRHGCRLQVGGSDQWGNIVAGLDLIRRVVGVDAEPAHALTVPLVTKADGNKFGKTAGGGTIWLDPELTSPYEFHQFWLNADDRDAVNFLKYFSLQPREQLEAVIAEQEAHPASRAAQRFLADELTALVHSPHAQEQATAAAAALFGKGDLAAVEPDVVAAALATAPNGQLEQFDESVPVVDLLLLAGLVKSKGEARRTINEGGAYLNDMRVSDEQAVATIDDAVHGRWFVLRRGKRKIGSVALPEAD